MRMKNNKGITLIALVITIIVLLILAGVTISMVLGDDGIIKQAQLAKKAQEKGEVDDKNAITDAQRELSKYSMPKYENVKDSTDLAKENSTIDGKGVSYTNPVIPKGFKTVNVGEVIWGEEGAVDKGLVIEDGEGNQFVWVPVDGVNVQLKSDKNSYYKEAVVLTYDTNTLNLEAILESKYEEDGLQAQFNAEYNDMKESVKAYGGFYVGRYETSWTGSKVASVQGATKTKQEGTNEVFTVATDLGTEWTTQNTGDKANKATWYGLYAKQKELYNKESDSVVSGMIYGCQWDAIMDWMSGVVNPETENKYINDSTGMGHFCYDSFGNLLPEYEGSGAAPIKTGAYSVKNIFDLAGNYVECTQQAYKTGYRVRQGGSYGTKNGTEMSASHYANFSPTTATGSYSSRLQLYIK